MRDADWLDITACLDGDEQAYARLVRRYETEVASLMWRFSRTPTECEELVQEVFVEAYFSLASYRRKGPFVHWLKRIGTRVGYRFWKKQAQQKHRVPIEDYDGIQIEPDSADSSAAGALLHALLAQLPRADRLVLTLMYFEDCSTKQIAERTGWNQAMVKMRAHRARKKIRAIAEKQGLLEELQWIR